MFMRGCRKTASKLHGQSTSYKATANFAAGNQLINWFVAAMGGLDG